MDRTNLILIGVAVVLIAVAGLEANFSGMLTWEDDSSATYCGYAYGEGTTDIDKQCADVDRNGEINQADITLINLCWGITESDSEWEDGMTPNGLPCRYGDIDRNGEVHDSDLSRLNLALQYGKSPFKPGRGVQKIVNLAHKDSKDLYKSCMEGYQKNSQFPGSYLIYDNIIECYSNNDCRMGSGALKCGATSVCVDNHCVKDDGKGNIIPPTTLK